jgi:hypothetical protein
MPTSYNYTCPYCSGECTIEEQLTGQNVICPNCSEEFLATPPDNTADIILPEKLPFFKSGRKKILEKRMQELIADGKLSKADEDLLDRTALLLGLEHSDLEEISKRNFFREFEPIQKRIEQAWVLTDEDLEQIDALKLKYGIEKVRMEGNASLFRQIYLVEVKGQLPAPVTVDLMLGSNEVAYYSVSSTWHQTRVHRHGYRGASFSVPTGIKGVRFRFGQYTPVRTEELTPLANGVLYCTSKRLLFQGDSRNTKVDLKKIVDAHIFSDSLKVEKATGKPDYFSMNAAQARFFTALIGRFREG